MIQSCSAVPGMSYFILLLVGPPSPPSNLTATPLNETSIKLTWSVPPGVLDEELISYLVEVRNESGGLTVLSETDGTEYTFTMDNPDPCDLYSFTVTPLCGMEGGTSAVENGTFLAGKRDQLTCLLHNFFFFFHMQFQLLELQLPKRTKFHL